MLEKTQAAYYEKRSFNEAGADCPGMPDPKQEDKPDENASMRPGQTAPECRSSVRPTLPTRRCFNEAGADCPGMLVTHNVHLQRMAIRFNEAGADCPGMHRD